MPIPWRLILAHPAAKGRVVFFGIVVALTACVSRQGDSPPPPFQASPTLLPSLDAREGAEPPAFAQVRATFAAARQSRYVHDARIDEAGGVFELDCSGFMEHVLSKGTPAALDEMRRGLELENDIPRRRPLARHFVRYLEALAAGRVSATAWESVERVVDLRRGDVIAWLRPEDARTRNTGHVMMATASPRPAPGLPGAWIVAIVDSTSTRHGPGDSRAPAGATGLGVGEILLVAQEGGQPTAYRWSPNSRRERVTTIAMGRPLR
jgi:hypothetical protein